MRIGRWWRDLKERDRRETDERSRYLGLLAVRDAFIVVMLLLSTLVIVQPFVGVESMDLAVPDVVVFFPLGVLMVAGVVLVISIALRGGFSQSPQSTGYRIILHVAGTLVGAGIVVTLAWLNIGPSLNKVLPILPGILVGILIGAMVLILWSRYNDR